MKAPSAAHAAAYGPFNSPSPISTPIANSSGSAGTTAPSTITASQNAIAKITPPAATGCAPIQATSWSNHPFVIGELYGAGSESRPPPPGPAMLQERLQPRALSSRRESGPDLSLPPFEQPFSRLLNSPS